MKKKTNRKKNAIKHFALYNNIEEWGKNSGTSTRKKILVYNTIDKDKCFGNNVIFLKKNK